MRWSAVKAPLNRPEPPRREIPSRTHRRRTLYERRHGPGFTSSTADEELERQPAPPSDSNARALPFVQPDKAPCSLAPSSPTTMRLPKSPSPLAVGLLLVALPATASAQAGDQLYDRSLPVTATTRLDVNVGDTDIRLEPGSSSALEVSVYVDASDPDVGRDYFERMELQVGLEGDEVRVRAREPRMGGSWWQRNRRVRVVTVIRHPPAMSMHVVTGDGDVLAGDLAGVVEIHTSDGDIEVGALTGGPARIETSDGDIRVRSASVSRLDVDTSDGDVTLGPTRSDLRVSSGDGDITVELDGSFPASVQTGDGDVTLYTPDEFDANLDVEGGEISVDRMLEVQGRVSDRRLRGAWGSGGPEIRIRSGDGDIRIR